MTPQADEFPPSNRPIPEFKSRHVPCSQMLQQPQSTRKHFVCCQPQADYNASHHIGNSTECRRHLCNYHHCEFACLRAATGAFVLVLFFAWSLIPLILEVVANAMAVLWHLAILPQGRRLIMSIKDEPTNHSPVQGALEVKASAAAHQNSFLSPPCRC